MRTKLLSDYVGKNEKTKIVAKLQRVRCLVIVQDLTQRVDHSRQQKGQGAPIREAPLSEQAQKEMMAYYYRKQEEHKVF